MFIITFGCNIPSTINFVKYGVKHYASSRLLRSIEDEILRDKVFIINSKSPLDDRPDNPIHSAGGDKKIKLKGIEQPITPTSKEGAPYKIKDESSKLNIKASVDPGHHAIVATKVGAIANIFLGISKGWIGLSVSSTALIADAANSFGDLLCDGVVYFTVSEARKRATPDRPWGTGKIEPLGALTVGGLLMATGIGIGYAAFLSAIDMIQTSSAVSDTASFSLINDAIKSVGTPSVSPFENNDSQLLDTLSELERIPSGSNQIKLSLSILERTFTPSNLQSVSALVISGLSVVTKEWLFRYTLTAGKKANSAAVIANAWQHRSDVAVSVAVFCGISGSMLGYPLLDPLAGILVAGVIVKQAFGVAYESYKDLSDSPASAKETEHLRHTCMNVKGIISIVNLQARKSGPYLYVEVDVGVNGNISASAAHRLAELTKLELMTVHKGRVANVIVNVEPLGSAGLGEMSPDWARDHDYIVEQIKVTILKMEDIIAVSEIQVYYKDNGMIAAKVDIVLSPTLTIKQAHEIAVKARRQIEEVMPGIKDVDIDLELDETK